MCGRKAVTLGSGPDTSDRPPGRPWPEFFLRALQSQKQRLGKKIEREHVMLAALPELSVLILELAREHSLKALVERGYLTLHGAGRGAWYGLA